MRALYYFQAGEILSTYEKINTLIAAIDATDAPYFVHSQVFKVVCLMR